MAKRPAAGQHNRQTAMDEERVRLGLLTNRLGALAVALSDLMQASLPAEVPAEGPDAAALNTVLQSPGLRVEDLAAILGMSHSGTVRVVDRLVRQGLVTRRPRPDDARSVSLHITAHGQELGDAVQARRLAALQTLVETLPAGAQGWLTATIEELLRVLADNPAAANRICRLCEERLCTPDICPTEDWARRHERIAAKRRRP